MAFFAYLTNTSWQQGSFKFGVNSTIMTAFVVFLKVIFLSILGVCLITSVLVIKIGIIYGTLIGLGLVIIVSGIIKIFQKTNK